MKTEINILDFAVPFIGGILIFSLLIIFIVFFIVLYRRKQVEYEYEKEQAKQLLLKTQIEIKEQTLSHISRELHDNLGQVASLIKINLGMIKETDENNKNKLNDSRELIKQLIIDIKSLSTTLKGENLQRFGLYNMIIKDIERLQKTSNIKFEVNGIKQLPSLKPETEIFLYRMVQECFNNILQHSKATKSILNVSLSNNFLTFNIKDNGVGFDTSKNKAGNGLINLQERCRIINADLQINSSINKGTEVIISLNCNEQN